MTLCPNCAMPVRDSARFCTSCGARIDGAAIAYVPPPAPQPEIRWEDEEIPPAWPAPPATTTWPGQEPQQWAPQAQSWPSDGGWGRAESGLPFDPAGDFEERAASVTEHWAPAEVEVEVEVEPDLPVVPAAAAWPMEPALEDDEFGGAIIDESFIETAALAEIPAPPPAVSSLSAAGALDAVAVRDRAAELLTELRDLLPRLANPSGVDPIALAAVLEAGIASDTLRWTDLRAVMEAARDRPRDVETVLALSQQVDNVLALLERHEQLTAAVQRAALQLRGE